MLKIKELNRTSCIVLVVALVFFINGCGYAESVKFHSSESNDFKRGKKFSEERISRGFIYFYDNKESVGSLLFNSCDTETGLIWFYVGEDEYSQKFLDGYNEGVREYIAQNGLPFYSRK